MEVSLTPRQRQVLGLLAAGLASKQIAGELDVSEAAVKKQIAVLCRKTGAANRASLVRRVIALGLLEP